MINYPWAVLRSFRLEIPPEISAWGVIFQESVSLSSLLWRPTQLYLFEEEGEGQKKLRNTFQSFSSRDYDLRSFRWPEISAWAEISDISGRKLRIFQRQCWAQGRWRGEGGGGGGEEDRIWMKFEKNIYFQIWYLNSGPLLATAQNYLLHSSLPLCSLLLKTAKARTLCVYYTYWRVWRLYYNADFMLMRFFPNFHML